MRILIIDNNTSFIDSILKLFKNHENKVISWKDFKYHKTNEYELIVLTGGHPNSIVYQHQLYEEELKEILRSDTPILGICLGFELIVYSFGGKLKELAKKEKNIVEINIIKPDELFRGINKLKVYESHRWVADQLPKELISLALSKDGIEVVRHITRFIYGFQFHPEIIVDKNDLKLFNNLIDMVSKKSTESKNFNIID